MFCVKKLNWLCYTVFLIWLMLQNVQISFAKTDKNACGLFNERVLFNNKIEASPIEFPWIGRLLHTDKNATFTTNCVGTLITKQHVILPAHCIYNNGDPEKPETFIMQMRLWIKTSDKIRVCNDLGYCTKKPKWYSLIDIKIHPYFDKYTHDNNIAIGTLNRTVKFSKYLMPICLEPKIAPDSYIGKYYFMGGFRYSHDTKTKTGALVLSPKYCTKHYASVTTALIRTHLCTHQELDIYINAGAPLMGINIERNVMKSFYIIGQLVTATKTNRPTTPIVSVFANVQLYIPWIKKNLIYPEPNTTTTTEEMDINE